MTPKPTPGPWWLSDETERDGLRSRLLHGMPEGMLAIIRVEHQGRYYGDANARLIAAAPDLLEALKALSASIFAPADDRSPELATAMQMTVNAISKATLSPSTREEGGTEALSKATPSLHEGERG